MQLTVPPEMKKCVRKPTTDYDRLSGLSGIRVLPSTTSQTCPRVYDVHLAASCGRTLAIIADRCEIAEGAPPPAPSTIPGNLVSARPLTLVDGKWQTTDSKGNQLVAAPVDGQWPDVAPVIPELPEAVMDANEPAEIIKAMEDKFPGAPAGLVEAVTQAVLDITAVRVLSVDAALLANVAGVLSEKGYAYVLCRRDRQRAVVVMGDRGFGLVQPLADDRDPTVLVGDYNKRREAFLAALGETRRAEPRAEAPAPPTPAAAPAPAPAATPVAARHPRPARPRPAAPAPSPSARVTAFAETLASLRADLAKAKDPVTRAGFEATIAAIETKLATLQSVPAEAAS